MSSQNSEELEKLLSRNGLAPSKWVEIFQKQSLMTRMDVESKEGDKELYESLCIDASTNEKSALQKILKLNIKEDIASCLTRVGLDAQYWSKIFREELFIQSPEALQFVGDESYEDLVKFVRKPWEKKALHKLLNLEISYENQQNIQKEKLAKRQVESPEFLKVLAKHQKEGKQRYDVEVSRVEEMFRERLKIPEDMWQKVEENGFSVITTASGGLALRGVLISENPSDIIAQRQHLLRVSRDIRLDDPVKSQFEEIKQFESQSNEEQYSKEIETFGYSVSAAAKRELWGVSFDIHCDYHKNQEEEQKEANFKEKSYTSTVKYCFMPLASCTFKEYQLQFSEDSLAHLHRIDKCLSELSVVHNECMHFFQKFGSHAFIGPLHFSGRYMWKCYTSGFKEIEREEAQALQSDVIGAHASVSFSGASGAENVSFMKGSLKGDYSQMLTSETFIQVKITGGPPNATGLVDWKNRLVGKSSTWHLIDRGPLHVPVWDIIEKNYACEFQNIRLLVATLKEKWQTKEQERESFQSEQVKIMVDSLEIWNENPDEAKYEAHLSTLVAMKKRVMRRRSLKPITWAQEYLSQQPLKKFMGLAVQSCMKGSTEHSTHLKGYIQQLVEPTDLDITRVFPNQEDVVRWLYNLKEGDNGDNYGVPLSSLLEEKQQKPDLVEKNVESLNLNDNKIVASLFKKMGLFDKCSNRLTASDGIAIREDLNPLKIKAELYPFCILQKLMAFDHRCRVPFSQDKHEESESDSESSHFSDSDSGSYSSCISDINDCKTIHPMDGLLALIHCSDNFLRQTLFSRLAACQLAVPLLLPDPFTKEPKFVLWALRSIIKEFKVTNNLHSGPIINYPAPIVSFLRVGRHIMSKSELLNSVINVTEHATFFHYNCDGGSAERILVNGLVEVSWYLPSANEKFFSDAITFVNLHGDARELSKQTNFLCKACSIHFVLLNDDVMDKYSLDQDTGSLLKDLSQAVGGVVILQTHSKSKICSERLLKALKVILRGKKKLSIIKLYEMNAAERTDCIQKKIYSILKDNSGQTLEYITGKCSIPLDEDDPHCVRGREESEIFQSLVDEFQISHPEESPKSLLILQSSEFWQKWVELDREQHHQQKRGHMSIYEYGAYVRMKMKQIREQQFQKAVTICPLMSSFLSSLRHLQGEDLWYYLQWVKLYLDNQSRKVLSPLHEQYRVKWKYLNDIKMEKENDKIKQSCREDMHHLNLQIQNASFGIEHLLREISQIYEVVALQEDAPKEIKDNIVCLPQIAAQLLLQGFPLELLDGDASHMPQRWISAVFQCLSNILRHEGKDPRVFIISVLGLQSTGKSTMLNTLFGVEFSVSAGRCTCGAFMQLIPVHESLSTKCGLQYFLIIDTEGLRAPELDTLQTQKHDNELATFVIGMANLTLINVKGEIAGDMDDILQTAVHAFLRMKVVNLNLSCHFVHQNVGDVAADQKLLTGRFNMNDKLDKMTSLAAKETGLENEISYFSQVIDFNYQKDISLFPNLWSGSPPMAPVNPAYSTEASLLKHVIIQLHSEDDLKFWSSTIPKFCKHLEEMWKAVLQEDFVFSFRNTFEIAAYRALEDEYNKWSWDFKKKMIEWEDTAQCKLMGCTQDSLPGVNKELEDALLQYISEMYEKYKALMNSFFDESEERRIILSWKQNYETKLIHLRYDLERHADKHRRELFGIRRGHKIADKKKEILVSDVKKRVEQFVVSLKKDKVNKEELEEEFEKCWNEEVEILLDRNDRLLPDIPLDVEKCLTKFFSEQKRSLITDKLKGIPLKDCGEHLGVMVRADDINLKMSKFMKAEVMDTEMTLSCVKEQFTPQAQIHIDIALEKMRDYLIKKKESDKNFNPEFTTEMLHNLFDNLSEVESDEFSFSEDFKIHIAIMCCGHAISIFEKMAEAFRRKHDPVEYIQTMRPHYWKLFMDTYHQIEREKTAAETLCQQLKDPIKQYVIRTVSRCVADTMRHDNPWIESKKSLIGCILLDIGKSLQKKDYNFHDCATFLKNPGASMKQWVKYYVAQYCDAGCPSIISQKALRVLSETIHLVISKANEVSHTFLRGSETFHISGWLKEFYKTCLEGKFDVQYSSLCLVGPKDKFRNIKFFTDEFVKGLDLILNILEDSLQDLKYSQLIALEIAPHDAIFDQVAGCTKQCPFCKAPCEHTNENHPESVKHSAEHWPECLGGYKWASDKTMVLDICTSLVASDCKFRNSDTNNQWHPYKKYADYYPEWKISPDPSLEASIFWKWLVGHFARDIEKLNGLNKTSIPDEWKSLKWDYVECEVKKSYNLN